MSAPEKGQFGESIPKAKPEPAPVMDLCGWCEGYEAAHAKAVAEGYLVNTTICPACRAREFREAHR